MHEVHGYQHTIEWWPYDGQYSPNQSCHGPDAIGFHKLLCVGVGGCQDGSLVHSATAEYNIGRVTAPCAP